MAEDNREIIIRRARCFECGGELTLGRDRGCFVMAAVLSGWVSVRVEGGSFCTLGENNLLISGDEGGLIISKNDGGSANILTVEFECGSAALEKLTDRVIPLSRQKRRYLGEIVREMGRKDIDARELCFDRGEAESSFGERVILDNALSSLLVRIRRDLQDESFGNPEEDFEVRNQAQALRRYLYENYKTKITLDGLCFIFRSNKTTICKIFKEEYGMTVLGYLNSLRLGEAKRMILEERLSVTEIAESLGFESIHYFTRFFKKMTSQTPTEYARIVGERKRIAEQ